MNSQSRFIEHYTRHLAHYSPPSIPSESQISNVHIQTSLPTNTEQKQKLQSLLVEFDRDPSLDLVDRAITYLDEPPQTRPVSLVVSNIDLEAEDLERAVMTKAVVALYSHSLEVFLNQSVELENEAQWWSRIERSQWRTAFYLLQTSPSRALRLFRTIADALKSHNIPMQISQFKPSSLRELFPSTSTLKPSILVTSLFPRLEQADSTSSVTALLSYPSQHTYTSSSLPSRISYAVSSFLDLLWRSFTLPLVLTQHECKHNRRELERLRDQRSEILGRLSKQRISLEAALERETNDVRRRMFYHHLQPFAISLKETIAGNEGVAPTSPYPPGTPLLIPTVQYISGISLPSAAATHSTQLSHLSRPSRLTLRWPKLILVPPATLYAVGRLYVSRYTLQEMAVEAVQTIKAFFIGWLLEPMKDVIHTVRAKDGEGIIVRPEGVNADLQSLERMTVALAKDHLRYSQEELTNLSRQIRLGDLTPVLKVYEEDIKSPLKSAITGTLLRTLFIQVQKAKVDIDQALTGIDKLLKSQELTFAFVGVAPAFGILYLTSGYVSQLWRQGKGSGRFGGRERRLRLMFTMRRIERLLVADGNYTKSEVSDLTAGLLLLSVANLRSYGESYLPSGSRFREGFLEDVDDLSDPRLGREEKKQVIQRMWRTWGSTLGWTTITGQ